MQNKLATPETLLKHEQMALRTFLDMLIGKCSRMVGEAFLELKTLRNKQEN
jgi:hypothetical protein